MPPGFSGAGSNAAGILYSIKVAPSPWPPEDVVADLRAGEAAKPLGPCPSGSPFARGTASPRLRRAEKEHSDRRRVMATSRKWCEVRGRQVAPPPLSPAVETLIREWFSLVDDDGSGALTARELAAALKTAGIPCTDESLLEMLNLMDFDRDGLIGWKEFHSFIAFEVYEGQDVIHSELRLPSGLSLPLGNMIKLLRRKRVIVDIQKGGMSRSKGVERAQTYITNMDRVSQATALKPVARRGSEAQPLRPSSSSAELPPHDHLRLSRRRRPSAVAHAALREAAMVAAAQQQEPLFTETWASFDGAPPSEAAMPFLALQRDEGSTNPAAPRSTGGGPRSTPAAAAAARSPSLHWGEPSFHAGESSVRSSLAAADLALTQAEGAALSGRRSSGTHPGHPGPPWPPWAPFRRRSSGTHPGHASVAAAGLQLIGEGGYPWPRLRLSDMGEGPQEEGGAPAAAGEGGTSASPSEEPGPTAEAAGRSFSDGDTASLSQSPPRCTSPLRSTSPLLLRSAAAAAAAAAAATVVSEQDMLGLEARLARLRRKATLNHPPGSSGSGGHMTFAGGSGVLFATYGNDQQHRPATSYGGSHRPEGKDRGESVRPFTTGSHQSNANTSWGRPPWPASDLLQCAAVLGGSGARQRGPTVERKGLSSAPYPGGSSSRGGSPLRSSSRVGNPLRSTELQPSAGWPTMRSAGPALIAPSNLPNDNMAIVYQSYGRKQRLHRPQKPGGLEVQLGFRAAFNEAKATVGSPTRARR